MPSQVSAGKVGTDSTVWNRMLLLHAHVENRLSTALQRRHGLGLSEYRALSFLDQAENDELRMQELADKLGLNQSSVTRLVGRLNSAEFTYRDLCPDDKRGVYTVITDAGRRRYQEASATYNETLSAALDEVAATDPAIAAILATARETA
ncbi:MarR family winged helix-turn-helix transcriptional regulator [Nocardia sp. CDC160]|uniref:MarR family winged helix-turn-helix transcriptional regulator n=1 Tax=Nocardia sp. CDC160 TaxID=3112166 RepID=UPI002DB8EB63|nr:MarR family transcriptional regulator [Nocardia sp. CDC160]MEC3917236.1 MarR family transcriptional regulator [Nocardia sp. CDC160]